MIVVRDVHKTFDGTPVLRGISFTVERGEAVVVIGPSGSGKSTLLQCINGLEPIDSGSILVDGIEVHDPRTDLNALRRRIGIVFQQFNVFPHLTALENVALAPRVVLRLPKTEAVRRAEAQLSRLGLLDKRDQLPTRLSGGQQQRLAIARSLALEPAYMLFDEITSALDPELVDEVLDALRMLRREGMTMICVTHEMGFAREVADRVLFVDEGRVIEEGPPARLFQAPREERTRQFLRRILRSLEAELAPLRERIAGLEEELATERARARALEEECRRLGERLAEAEKRADELAGRLEEASRELEVRARRIGELERELGRLGRRLKVALAGVSHDEGEER